MATDTMKIPCSRSLRVLVSLALLSFVLRAYFDVFLGMTGQELASILNSAMARTETVPHVEFDIYGNETVQNHTGSKRTIAFVHVGKTGGTTLKDLLRKGCFPNQRRCFQQRANGIPKETQISLQTQEYFHVRRLGPVQQFSSFIVTTRNPIERFMSWFLFEHPRNRKQFGRRVSPGVFDNITACYEQMEDLAVRGLATEKPDLNETCQEQQLARYCVMGRYEGCGHMFYNYEYYTRPILMHPEKEVFAVRTEHLWDDWANINVMLGGSRTVHKPSAITHRRGKDPLPVYNKSISEEGLRNVCRVLCKEIQIYKTLIRRAVNLDNSMKLASFQELGVACPKEATEEDCPPEERFDEMR